MLSIRRSESQVRSRICMLLEKDRKKEREKGKEKNGRTMWGEGKEERERRNSHELK